MKVGGGPSWSLRAPSLFVAVLGLAVLGSGCIIDGTSRADSDLDTIDDVFDACPLQPETFNGFQDTDGCPDSTVDSDLDGIQDAIDVCPLQPETFNGFQDSDGCPDSTPTCVPDLTISWRIISNLDGQILTCSEAGGADTVTAWIDGGGLAALTAFDSDCLAGATQGSFVAELPSSGTYNVSLELTARGTTLSETTILVQPVDCSGLTATPRADLLVNF